MAGSSKNLLFPALFINVIQLTIKSLYFWDSLYFTHLPIILLATLLLTAAPVEAAFGGLLKQAAKQAAKKKAEREAAKVAAKVIEEALEGKESDEAVEQSENTAKDSDDGVAAQAVSEISKEIANSAQKAAGNLTPSATSVVASANPFAGGILGGLIYANPEKKFARVAAETLNVTLPETIDPDTISVPVIDTGRNGFNKKALNILGKADKVAVAGFRVVFITTNSDTATSDGRATALVNRGLMRSGAKVYKKDSSHTLNIQLLGVEPSMMQMLADAAYQDFMMRLEETGREIVPAETILANEGFKSLNTYGFTTEHPFVKKAKVSEPHTYIVFSPESLPLWFTHADAGSVGNVAPMALKNWRALNQLSFDTGSVVIVPQITIDFAKFSASGRLNIVGSAKVIAEQVISLVPKHTQLYVYQAKAKTAGPLATTELNRAVEIHGNYAAGEMISRKNLNLSDAFGKYGDFNFSSKAEQEYAFVANPDSYLILAGAGIQAANQYFAQAVKLNR